MSSRSHRSTAHSGPWSAEPVRDAIVAQRMQDLRAGLRATHVELPLALSIASANVRPTGSRAGLVRGLRLRVGHALVQIGSFIEGRCDPAESPATRTA